MHVWVQSNVFSVLNYIFFTPFAKIMLNSVYIFLAVLPALVWSPYLRITFCISQILINLLRRAGPRQVLKKPGWYVLWYESENILFLYPEGFLYSDRINPTGSNSVFLPLMPPKNSCWASGFTRPSINLPRVIDSFNNIHAGIKFSNNLKP